MKIESQIVVFKYHLKHSDDPKHRLHQNIPDAVLKKSTEKNELVIVKFQKEFTKVIVKVLHFEGNIPITSEIARMQNELPGILTELEARVRRTVNECLDACRYFLRLFDILHQDALGTISTIDLENGDSTPRAIFENGGARGNISAKAYQAVHESEFSGLQNYLDTGMTASIGLEYLYRAMRETAPRFRWIDAAIAAEICVKDAILRRNPDFDVRNVRIKDLYGKCVRKNFGVSLPDEKILQDGANLRNVLAHAPTQNNTRVSSILSTTNDYVNAVWRTMAFLHGLLHPNCTLTKGLLGLDVKHHGY